MFLRYVNLTMQRMLGLSHGTGYGLGFGPGFGVQRSQIHWKGTYNLSRVESKQKMRRDAETCYRY